MTPRREYAIVWLVLAVAGAGLFFAARATWATGTETLSSGTVVDVSVSGSEFTPWVVAAAIAIIAMALLVLITGRVVRVIAGALALMAGWGSTLVSARVAMGVQLSAIFNARQVEVTATAWGWVAALLGLIAGLAALLVIVRASRWPTFSTRYERGDTTPRDAWEALDRGVDPTVDQ